MRVLDIVLLSLHNLEHVAREENSGHCPICGGGRGHRTNWLTKLVKTDVRPNLQWLLAVKVDKREDWEYQDSEDDVDPAPHWSKYKGGRYSRA